MSHMSTRSKGFTLVEMLVVVPLAILVVGGLVTIIFYTATTALRSQVRAQLQLDVLAALDTIEQDVRLSLNTGETIISPAEIKLTSLATSSSNYNPDRKLIQPNCHVGAAPVAISDAKKYKTRIYIEDKKLKRQTEYTGCTSGSHIWQLSSGSAVVILDNAKEVSLDITRIDPGTLKVLLSATRQVVGQDVTYQGEMFVRSINI